MKKIALEITGMSYSQSQSGAYALILGEVKGDRKLPIIIGTFEAQSIALGMEKMHPIRPMTHDLFKSFAQFYHIQLKEVIINKFENGVFHALLVCENNRVISEIDARTSDAVALAIRFQCPIFAYEPVMEEAGIIVTDENEPEKTTKTKESGETFDEFSEYLIEELEEMLQIAVEKEAYEKASRLRDEIQRRKSAL